MPNTRSREVRADCGGLRSCSCAGGAARRLTAGTSRARRTGTVHVRSPVESRVRSILRKQGIQARSVSTDGARRPTFLQRTADRPPSALQPPPADRRSASSRLSRIAALDRLGVWVISVLRITSMRLQVTLGACNVRVARRHVPAAATGLARTDASRVRTSLTSTDDTECPERRHEFLDCRHRAAAVDASARGAAARAVQTAAAGRRSLQGPRVSLLHSTSRCSERPARRSNTVSASREEPRFIVAIRAIKSRARAAASGGGAGRPAQASGAATEPLATVRFRGDPRRARGAEIVKQRATRDDGGEPSAEHANDARKGSARVDEAARVYCTQGRRDVTQRRRQESSDSTVAPRSASARVSRAARAERVDHSLRAGPPAHRCADRRCRAHGAVTTSASQRLVVIRRLRPAGSATYQASRDSVVNAAKSAPPCPHPVVLEQRLAVIREKEAAIASERNHDASHCQQGRHQSCTDRHFINRLHLVVGLDVASLPRGVGERPIPLAAHEPPTGRSQPLPYQYTSRRLSEPLGRLPPVRPTSGTMSTARYNTRRRLPFALRGAHTHAVREFTRHG
jgi:hypothetical protein